MIDHTTFAAPVPGGLLAGGQWRADAAHDPSATAPPVLAVHGISATHRSWDVVAAGLGGRRVIAPDLRGRGRSNRLPGPFGLERHADDLVAVLDHLGVERALVLGHSMGAFVSVRLAERHPDRVAGLVLVDGGLPIPNPEGIAPEELPAVLLGPALERLSMTFPDRAAYLDFWRRHPALGPYWNEAIAAYVDYDVDGEEPTLRSSANPEAVAENSLQLDGSAGYAAALEALAAPVDVFRAPRGLLDGDPLYTPSLVAAWAARMPALRVHEVPDVNHYTIVMGAGARMVVPLVEARLAELTAAGAATDPQHPVATSP